MVHVSRRSYRDSNALQNYIRRVRVFVLTGKVALNEEMTANEPYVCQKCEQISLGPRSGEDRGHERSYGQSEQAVEIASSLEDQNSG